MKSTLMLVSILVLGFCARSRIIIVASLLLLLLKEIKIEGIFEFLSNWGIEIGLIFLLLAILSSIVLEPVSVKDLKNIIFSYKGIIAVLAGLMATRFNEMGLGLLNTSPQLIIGIIVGSILGVIILDGIPVGPLMAAGLAALLVRLFEFILSICHS